MLQFRCPCFRLLAAAAATSDGAMSKAAVLPSVRVRKANLNAKTESTAW